MCVCVCAFGKSVVSNSSDVLDIQAKVRKQFKCFTEGPYLDEMADPYAWWAAQDPNSCSLLIPLARRLLTVPGSNGDVERFVSWAKSLFDHLRMSMDSATAERALLFAYNMEVLGMWEPAPGALHR